MFEFNEAIGLRDQLLVKRPDVLIYGDRAFAGTWRAPPLPPMSSRCRKSAERWTPEALGSFSSP